MQIDPFYYRRHLPHYQPENAAFFVTFILAGSLPVKVIEEMRMEQKMMRKRIEELNNRKVRADEWFDYNVDYFNRFDGLLDRIESGPFWLENSSVAEIVKESIHYRDQKEYDLIAYCIMPNHVHMVFDSVGRLACPERSRGAESTNNGRDSVSTYRITRILESLKKYTALRANRLLGRKGSFWQHESYDHVIRDDADLSRIVDYVLLNPVNAGLVSSWEKWPWTYLKNQDENM